jgi:predicted nuclease of restriction endonuclease-like RecB superfamily
MAVYGVDDAPWIGSIVDEVERGVGQPWRVVVDRLDRLPLPGVRIKAVVMALRRLGGGRGANPAVARRTRALVLGVPALDAAVRTKRIADASDKLGVSPAEIEHQLWMDLASERAVAMPNGRPSELQVAAFANERKIRRTLMRAESITLRVWGDARPIVRAAAARGLIATIGAGSTGETIFEVCGPLAIVHHTTVYGRALAGFVQHLARCERFELDIRCNFGHGAFVASLASPIVLPEAARAKSWKLVDKLARELAKADLEVVRDPPPVAAGSRLAFPHLIANGVHVEVVGFWTEAYLAAKIARYRDAGARVVVCAHSRSVGEPPRGVVMFDGAISAAAVITAIEDASRPEHLK